MRSVRNILSVVCGYVAAVIGAGFASGQEIVSFFVRYGRYSIFGIAVSCIIFAAFAYAVLAVCVGEGVSSYSEYLNVCFGRRTRKLIGALTMFFAMSALCVMTACAGEVGTAILGVDRMAGSAAFALLCALIFLSGGRRVIKLNSSLGAIIIVGIVFCCLYMLRFREHQVFMNGSAIFLSGTSYAGYNLITAGMILAGMSRYLKDKREAAIGAVCAGIILFILITLIWLLLSIYYGQINLGEIPMLTMALRQSKIMGAIYSIMLFFAVFTTAISNGYGIAEAAERRMGRVRTVFFMMFIAFCMSGAGFSRLIDTVYRLCGYAGILLVLFEMFTLLKVRKNE